MIAIAWMLRRARVREPRRPLQTLDRRHRSSRGASLPASQDEPQMHKRQRGRRALLGQNEGDTVDHGDQHHDRANESPHGRIPVRAPELGIGGRPPIEQFRHYARWPRTVEMDGSEPSREQRQRPRAAYFANTILPLRWCPTACRR